MSRIDAALLALAALGGLAWLGVRRGWPGSRRLRDAWLELAPRVRAYVRRAPATFTYASILFITTWVVAGVGRRVSDEVLRSQSTNLHNLRTHPISALFRSMFWSGSSWLLPVMALLAAVLAPAEVWLGTKRLIAAFLVGHVGATLVTALAISQGVLTGSGDRGLDRDIDVGVSYGTICVAALLTYRLPRRWRLPYAAGLVGLFAVLAFATGRTYTDLGHFVSVLLGLALYPLTRSAGVSERARIPPYRPWKATA
jgi:hypothetical protein